MATYQFTAVAATVQQCQIAPDAGAIYVINTSRFDLQVALSWGQPDSSNNFAGLPDVFTVSRGDRRGIPVPRDNYGANGFPGWVWVLPVDNSGQLALSGIGSANALFTIITYRRPDQLPPDYASVQAVDASSQPRYVVLPPALAFLRIGGLSGAQLLTNAHTSLGGFAGITTASSNVGDVIDIYLYVVVISPYGNAAAGQFDFSITARYTSDAAGTTTTGGPFTIYRDNLTWGANTEISACRFLPPYPLLVQVTKAAGMNYYFLEILVNSSVNASPIAYTVSEWVDVLHRDGAFVAPFGGQAASAGRPPF